MERDGAGPRPVSELPRLPRPRPERVVLQGTYVRLEPLTVERHRDELLAASSRPGAEERFRYLAEPPPAGHDFDAWLAGAAASSDPLFWAVVDLETGRCEGRQALMRTVSEHGVTEIGSILWNPPLAGTRAATEAFYLLADYALTELDYRRLEWKCDALNSRSRRAAARFGFTFEGVFEQHMVIKGANRDTAWFALLDREWPAVRRALRAWLAPDNFTADGRQLRRLSEYRGSGHPGAELTESRKAR